MDENLEDKLLPNDRLEIRKQATKSLFDDIKFQLENEIIEKPSNIDDDVVDDEESSEVQKQISIDDINVTKNIR